MALSKIDVANMLTGLVPNDNTIRRPNANALIINGDLAVAQRTTSTSSVSSGSNFVSDRFTFGPSTAGTWTISQEAITSGSPFDDGFRTAFKADNTTANGSLSGGSNLQFAQKIEAQDLQVLKYGSSTGTNVIEIFGHDSSRSVSVAYTVSTTNTWEKKTVSIPADTGGTINNDNGTGLEVIWWLVAGSNFTSGSLQTSWAANSATARAVGQVNHADSTSNNVHIAGVQLEVGEYTSATIPPFLNESFGDNLHRCCRYFFYTGGGAAYQSHGTGVDTTTTAAYLNIPLPNILRSSPSITKEDSLVIWDGNSESAITSLGNIYYSARGSLVNVSVVASGGGVDDAAGIIVYSNADGSSGFLISAEL